LGAGLYSSLEAAMAYPSLDDQRYPT